MANFKIEITVVTRYLSSEFTLTTYAALSNDNDWVMTSERLFATYEGACAAGLRYLEMGKL
jgi:hypothetical protein